MYVKNVDCCCPKYNCIKKKQKGSDSDEQTNTWTLSGH